MQMGFFKHDPYRLRITKYYRVRISVKDSKTGVMVIQQEDTITVTVPADIPEKVTCLLLTNAIRSDLQVITDDGGEIEIEIKGVNHAN